MPFDRMKARVRALPQVAAWPQMLDLVERAVHRDLSVWELPIAACQAVGGSAEAALAGAAAVFCSLASIHLVDDMLDDDPRGDYHRFGAGPTANLALAFQAAGHHLVDEAEAPAGVRAELHACLGRMALATAFGQHLDTREVASEAEYWRVVGAKTPPLFGAALHLGALLGGAPSAVAGDFERLGDALGRFVQVSDDLSDALRTPAGADWQRPSNNLAILYAMTADHPGREEFCRLLGVCQDPEPLAAAQKLLVRSGAVSYCVYRMIGLSREAQDIVASIAVRDREPLFALLRGHLRPLDRLLAAVGYEEPGLSKVSPAVEETLWGPRGCGA